MKEFYFGEIAKLLERLPSILIEAICVNERRSRIGCFSKHYIELQFEMIDGFVGMIESFQFDLKSTAFHVCEPTPQTRTNLNSRIESVVVVSSSRRIDVRIRNTLHA